MRHLIISAFSLSAFSIFVHAAAPALKDARLTGAATVADGASLTIASGGVLILAEGAMLDGLYSHMIPNLDETMGGFSDALGEVTVNLANETDARILAENTLQSGIATNTANIAANASAIAALAGRGGVLPAHDFGTATPDSEALTVYFLQAIWGTGGTVFYDAESPAQSTWTLDDVTHTATEIWNATSVLNLANGHEIKINNTPETTPPIFEFVDIGQAFVNVATTETQGVVKAGSAVGQVAVNPTTGLMSVNGWDDVVTLAGGQTINGTKSFANYPWLERGIKLATGETATVLGATVPVSVYIFPQGAGYTTPSWEYKVEIPKQTGTLALTSDITKAAAGLGNVDNTADLDKPISTATQAALDAKASLAQLVSLGNTKLDKKTSGLTGSSLYGVSVSGSPGIVTQTTYPLSQFATAAQGAKANTALQPGTAGALQSLTLDDATTLRTLRGVTPDAEPRVLTLPDGNPPVIPQNTLVAGDVRIIGITNTTTPVTYEYSNYSFSALRTPDSTGIIDIFGTSTSSEATRATVTVTENGEIQVTVKGLAGQLWNWVTLLNLTQIATQ